MLRFHRLSTTHLVIAAPDSARTEIATALAAIDAESIPVAINAAAGAEALKADLTLVDLRGDPRMGLALCVHFKSIPALRLVPLLAITEDNAAARATALDAGADDAMSGSGAPFARELQSRVRSHLRVRAQLSRLDDATQVIYALANAVEAKDVYTEGHTERVGQLSALIGRHAGLDADAQDALAKGGVLHDIGKIGIPNALLNKRGVLTAKERIVMNKHPIIGERICEPLRSIRDLCPMIRSHHERLDGSGYPDGLRGDAFPLSAQILQLADIFDAITTDRPYHRARTRQGAVEFMLGEARKGWRDAELVKVCARAAEELGLGRTREEDIPPPPAPIGSWRWE